MASRAALLAVRRAPAARPMAVRRFGAPGGAEGAHRAASTRPVGSDCIEHTHRATQPYRGSPHRTPPPDPTSSPPVRHQAGHLQARGLGVGRVPVLHRLDGAAGGWAVLQVSAAVFTVVCRCGAARILFGWGGGGGRAAGPTEKELAEATVHNREGGREGGGVDETVRNGRRARRSGAPPVNVTTNDNSRRTSPPHARPRNDLKIWATDEAQARLKRMDEGEPVRTHMACCERWRGVLESANENGPARCHRPPLAYRRSPLTALPKRTSTTTTPCVPDRVRQALRRRCEQVSVR